MRQKIIKVGNSAAVTIPKKVLREIGLKVGDEIEFEINHPYFKADPEIHKLTQKLIKEYGPALERLAKTIKWTEEYIEKNRPALAELAKK